MHNKHQVIAGGKQDSPSSREKEPLYPTTTHMQEMDIHIFILCL